MVEEGEGGGLLEQEERALELVQLVARLGVDVVARAGVAAARACV